MMQRKTLFPFLLLFIISISIGIVPIYAVSPTQSIRVSPVIIHISLRPGNATTYPVTVENLTENPLPLTALIEGFDTSDELGGYDFSAPTKESELSTWITIDTPNMIIPAKEKKQINLTVTLPKTISLGGYYAMLFFTPLSRYDVQNQVILPRVGVLLLANVGVPDPNLPAEKKIHIKTFDLLPQIISDGAFTLTLRAQNTSLNYFSAKPVLTFIPRIGSFTQMDLTEKVLLPGKIRSWNETINTLPYGIYTARLSIGTGDHQAVIREKHIAKLPLRHGIIAIVLCFVIGFLFIKRKNMKKSLKAFVK